MLPNGTGRALRNPRGLLSTTTVYLQACGKPASQLYVGPYRRACVCACVRAYVRSRSAVIHARTLPDRSRQSGPSVQTNERTAPCCTRERSSVGHPPTVDRRCRGAPCWGCEPARPTTPKHRWRFGPFHPPRQVRENAPVSAVEQTVNGYVATLACLAAYPATVLPTSLPTSLSTLHDQVRGR